MTNRHPTSLTPAATRLRRVFARPKLILGMAMLVALGWAYIGLTVSHVLHAFMPSSHAWTAADFAAAALMWGAMALAMMLPSAGPMIVTYAEIAETAANKGERIVSPFVMAAGYVVVWLGFAIAAAFLQGGLHRAALLDSAAASTSALLSAALLAAAGLYQFSALKHVCLTRCQRPFPFFLANWTIRPSGVFRLGLRQGFYCLGCCWALMLLMFTVGLMNVAWMIVLGAVIIAEKMTATALVTRAVGVLLIVSGAALALAVGGPR